METFDGPPLILLTFSLGLRKLGYANLKPNVSGVMGRPDKPGEDELR